ncbi:MAG: hypothetical protein RIC89_19530 [Pseudomonadales bacterium]
MKKRNDHYGRDRCRILAIALRSYYGTDPLLDELATKLEAIAGGEDPAAVMFGGDPREYNLAGEALVTLVDQKRNYIRISTKDSDGHTTWADYDREEVDRDNLEDCKDLIHGREWSLRVKLKKAIEVHPRPSLRQVFQELGEEYGENWETLKVRYYRQLKR